MALEWDDADDWDLELLLGDEDPAGDDQGDDQADEAGDDAPRCPQCGTQEGAMLNAGDVICSECGYDYGPDEVEGAASESLLMEVNAAWVEWAEGEGGAVDAGDQADDDNACPDCGTTLVVEDSSHGYCPVCLTDWRVVTGEDDDDEDDEELDDDGEAGEEGHQ